MDNEENNELLDIEIVKEKNITKVGSPLKKIFTKVGYASLVGSGCFLSSAIGIFQFICTAGVGILMVIRAIYFFTHGSIIWGLVMLFIATPLAIGIVSYLFIPVLFLAVFSLLVWGIMHLFGITIVFYNMWSYVWFGVKTLIAGSIVVFCSIYLIQAIKDKKIKRAILLGLAVILTIVVFIFLIKQANTLNYSRINETTMNIQEQDIISKVLSQKEPLTEQDSVDLRNSLQSYVNRTGNYFTEEDVNNLSFIAKVSNDYYYELLQSMLLSWDNKKYTTTKDFDALFQGMKGYRSNEQLTNDKNRIEIASQNQSIDTDENGNQYELNRDSIVKQLDQINIAKDNFYKIISVFKEFIK